MDLDFSDLTDDQLVQLIRAACAEAVNRGAACAKAAHGVYLDAVEQARVAHAAAEREADRLRQAEVERIARETSERMRRDADRKKIDEAAESEAKRWARHKGIAMALEAAGYPVEGDSLTVWLSGSNEKRVFLQQGGYGGATFATLYVTGNKRHPPGSIEWSPRVVKEYRPGVAAVLAAVAKEWNTLKVDLEKALAWQGDAIAPKHLAPAKETP
jgi:hypothetical protein